MRRTGVMVGFSRNEYGFVTFWRWPWIGGYASLSHKRIGGYCVVEHPSLRNQFEETTERNKQDSVRRAGGNAADWDTMVWVSGTALRGYDFFD